MRNEVAQPESVAELFDEMPTGVSVGPDGRIFLCFPRWFDRVRFTVGELRGKDAYGRAVVTAYPDSATNRLDLYDPVHHFVSVQSVIATDEDTLWVLDSGRPWFLPSLPGAAKLVEVDLRHATARRTYEMPYSIARPLSYLNDVRFDFHRGTSGIAYITDSATLSPSALIVVDLHTGAKLRRLEKDPRVQPDKKCTPVIERKALRIRLPFFITLPYQDGSDGIALSEDGATLYYCPLSSRTLYSVDAETLADPKKSDAEVAETICDLGEKGFSDGLETDTAGRVYAGDLENNRILVRQGNEWQTLVECPDMLWTDTLAIARDGYIYHTANQLHRMAIFNSLWDRRKKPYHLFRTRIPSGRVSSLWT
jgi:sugar lactone lactonase YvrE